MGWLYLKTTFNEGMRLTDAFQKAFVQAYAVHLGAGGELLREAGVFTRSKAVEQSYEFYFSPQVQQLLGTMATGLGATPCEKPSRKGTHRMDELRLSVGEQSAYELIQDE